MAYTGVYERTIFYNPVNKYSVISVKTSDRSIPEKARSAYRHRDNMIHFAAVGYELPRTDQVSMILDGEWKEGKNGVQLHTAKRPYRTGVHRKGIAGKGGSRAVRSRLTAGDPSDVFHAAGAADAFSAAPQASSGGARADR